MRRSCGDPGKILSKRSLHEDLADAMSWRLGGFEQVLVSRSYNILSSGSRSFFHDSRRAPSSSRSAVSGFQILFKVFCKSLCEDLAEILANPS